MSYERQQEHYMNNNKHTQNQAFKYLQSTKEQEQKSTEQVCWKRTTKSTEQVQVLAPILQ